MATFLISLLSPFFPFPSSLSLPDIASLHWWMNSMDGRTGLPNKEHFASVCFFGPMINFQSNRSRCSTFRVLFLCLLLLFSSYAPRLVCLRSKPVFLSFFWRKCTSFLFLADPKHDIGGEELDDRLPAPHRHPLPHDEEVKVGVTDEFGRSVGRSQKREGNAERWHHRREKRWRRERERDAALLSPSSAAAASITLSLDVANKQVLRQGFRIRRVEVEG